MMRLLVGAISLTLVATSAGAQPGAGPASPPAGKATPAGPPTPHAGACAPGRPRRPCRGASRRRRRWAMISSGVTVVGSFVVSVEGVTGSTTAPTKPPATSAPGTLPPRHDIRVALDNSPGNGVTATVDLPPSLLTADAEVPAPEATPDSRGRADAGAFGVMPALVAAREPGAGAGPVADPAAHLERRASGAGVDRYSDRDQHRGRTDREHGEEHQRGEARDRDQRGANRLVERLVAGRALGAPPARLVAAPPFHPSSEDRRDAPDRVFASLGDHVAEHLAEAWVEALVAAGARDADVPARRAHRDGRVPGALPGQPRRRPLHRRQPAQRLDGHRHRPDLGRRAGREAQRPLSGLRCAGGSAFLRMVCPRRSR